MEYLPLGNLAHAHRASPIAFEETFIVLSQTLQGLEYLNSRGYIHRDIKPANILVSSRSPLVIKLADFGLAKHDRNGDTRFKSFVGTHLYTAPELYEWQGKPYTYAVDIWSLGIVALELAYGLPKPLSGAFNAKDWFRRIFKAVEVLASDQLVDLLSNGMLQFRPERRLLASECLEKVLGIESALRATQTHITDQTSSMTPTENASVLNTPMWVPEDSYKRQRSPDPSFEADLGRRTTAFREERESDVTTVRLHAFASPDASLYFSGQPGPLYKDVLELLQNLQDGEDGNQSIDSHTTTLIQGLCHQFERLKVVEIKKRTNHEAGGITLTAITEAREFTLANLTSADLANSVAELADRLTQIMRLLSPSLGIARYSQGDSTPRQGAEMGKDFHGRNATTQIDPIKTRALEATRIETRSGCKPSLPAVDDSGCRRTNDTDSWSDGSSLRSRGLTYPSALLDITNVSGCAPP